MGRVRVALRAEDSLSAVGLAGLLRNTHEVELLSADQSGAAVLMFACHRLTAEATALLRRHVAEFGVPVVLVVSRIAETELLTAVQCGVVAVLPRTAVTEQRLVHSIRAAANGGGVMPPNLMGELLKQLQRVQRDVVASRSLDRFGLSLRQLDVLRLLADGLDSGEMAAQLKVSTRTVENIVSDLRNRYQLRNRSHLVAHAVRSGMI
ncbi:LuxR C-terminal-related transcriptional regulator [Winogradskya consettensis]|uniref:Helix-turn-helix transcriptional regulator n=1 Tax=Winogradskya consettensis TaxID=113560 RepID=A0A919VLS1_9ACTN|nr:LuxR C-terminal-related transcriptional regulator [Actinoplanes consettensis]GIM68050.1 helix-turn-helix transcriptional regulator [Actinoplanes consettensis]